MKVFRVTAKCGHVGRNNYVIKSFAIRAFDAREAARIARDIPRVKHHHKDAILDVQEITLDDYYTLVEQNSHDPYFRCHNVQDQRSYEEVVYTEVKTERKRSEVTRKTMYYGKELIRNPKRFIRNVLYTERFAI